jgi:hypothetical protein
MEWHTSCVGEQRSLKIGSVRMLTPPICTCARVNNRCVMYKRTDHQAIQSLFPYIRHCSVSNCSLFNCFGYWLKPLKDAHTPALSHGQSTYTGLGLRVGRQPWRGPGEGRVLSCRAPMQAGSYSSTAPRPRTTWPRRRGSGPARSTAAKLLKPREKRPRT